jgi:hydrogenase-4 component E
MSTFAFDVSHFLAGAVVLMSFAMLYQDRLPPLINAFMVQSLVLALSIAWQAQVQNAPHLLITAGIELGFKAVVIPIVLYALIRRLQIHRTVETVVGIGLTMIAGMALVGLAMALMMRVTPGIEIMARQDMAFALSVILLGLLIMVTRRNAVGQVVAFMSIENGLVLAATGAKGMPFVVETFVAFSLLIALIVIGIFLFRIRERFDTVDVAVLDQHRGERP